MALDYLQVFSASNSPEGLVIFLHGWGANAEDLYPLAPALNLPQYHFIFLAAPFPHPQVPGGLMWYDLHFPDPAQLQESRQQIQESVQLLSEETNIPLEKMVLAGFSQGGAMVLEVGFSLPLGGLICLSGYLHSEPQWLYQPPVFMAHGCFDPVVPVEKGKSACKQLQKGGISVRYVEFDMAHQIIPQELAQIRQVLIEWL